MKGRLPCGLRKERGQRLRGRTWGDIQQEWSQGAEQGWTAGAWRRSVGFSSKVRQLQESQEQKSDMIHYLINFQQGPSKQVLHLHSSRWAATEAEKRDGSASEEVTKLLTEPRPGGGFCIAQLARGGHGQNPSSSLLPQCPAPTCLGTLFCSFWFCCWASGWTELNGIWFEGLLGTFCFPIKL